MQTLSLSLRAFVFAGLLGWLAALCPSLCRASACSGDCDNNLRVGVDELIGGIRIALAQAPLTGCQSLDGDGNGQVAVDDLVRAVAQAVHGCSAAIAEAAVGVELSLIQSVDAWRMIDFGLLVGRPRKEAAGQPVCAFRGYLDQQCTVHDGVSTLTAAYVDCHNYDPSTDYNLIRAGDLSLIVNDPNACAAAVIPPPGASFVYTANFTDLVTDPLNRPVSSLVQKNFRGEFAAQDTLCGGIDGTASLDGALVLFDRHRAIDVAFDYHATGIGVSASPPACNRTTILRGTLSVDDRANLNRFDANVSGLTLAEEALTDGGRNLTVSGEIASECLGGPLSIHGEGLGFDANSECPVLGGEDLASASGERVRITATPAGGLQFDFGNDGSIDKVVEKCRDRSLAHCVEPAGSAVLD